MDDGTPRGEVSPKALECFVEGYRAPRERCTSVADYDVYARQPPPSAPQVFWFGNRRFFLSFKTLRDEVNIKKDFP